MDGHTERALRALERIRGRQAGYELNERNEESPCHAEEAAQGGTFALTPAPDGDVGGGVDGGQVSAAGRSGADRVGAAMVAARLQQTANGAPDAWLTDACPPTGPIPLAVNLLALQRLAALPLAERLARLRAWREQLRTHRGDRHGRP